MFKLDSEKAEEPEIKLSTSVEIIKKAREFQKNIYFCFIDYAKAFDCVDHHKLWKILQEMGIPDLPPEKCVYRSRSNSWNWTWNNRLVPNQEDIHQGYIFPPCLFNLYAEYNMRNVGLDEAQAGIKIAGRNINNLRYADDTNLMAEGEEELKILLMKVKEESEKGGLKLNIQKTKIMASGPITSWQIDGETMETVSDLMFLGSKISANADCSHQIKRRLCLGRQVITNLLLLSRFSHVQLCATP